MAAAEKAAAEQASLSSSSNNVENKENEGISNEHTSILAAAGLSTKPEAFNISNPEAVRRLRAKGQPIRLFGESDSERRLRLRALELIEERSEGQRNDFMRALEGMDKGLDLAELQRQGGGGSSNPALDRLKNGAVKEGSANPGSDSENPDSPAEGTSKTSAEQYGEVDLALVRKNPAKVYPQIYYGIKTVLKEWEEAMAQRPGRRKYHRNL